MLRPEVFAIKTELMGIDKNYLTTPVLRNLLPTQNNTVNKAEPVEQQSLRQTGYVTDINGQPLMGVAVLDVFDKYNGVVTDDNGYYEFYGLSNTKVDFSYLGFKTIQFDIKFIPSPLVMDESTENLDEVYLGVVKNKDNTWILLVGLVLAILTFFKK